MPMKPTHEVKVREVKVRQVQTAEYKRNHAQRGPDEKTHQVESRPGHGRTPTDFRFVALLRGCAPSSGFSTSLKRSPSCGASRTAPSRIKHLRVSSCRATRSSASLTSGS